jgi:cAMP-dependent protein kinase regulator
LKKAGGGGVPKRRQQIFGEGLEPEPTTITRMDIVMKSDATKLTLLTVLRKHFLFSQLRDADLEDVVDVMQLYCAQEGELIIRQGDHGETFYILEEGTVELIKDGDSWGNIEAASSFGDLALMYNCPRAATIIAKTYCTLWTLDRVFFRQATVTSSSHHHVQLSQFLQKISLFSNIGMQQLNQLARSLTKQSYEDGQYIIKQGDVGDQFYVVYRGKVAVSKTDDSGYETVLLELSEGEVFGERALIKKEPRKANVKAIGNVECYYLEKHDFELMLGEFVEKFNKMNEFRIIKAARIFQNRISEHRLREFADLFVTQRYFQGHRLVCNTGMIYLVLDGVFISSYNDRYAHDGNNVEVGTFEKSADEVAGALTVMSEEGVLASFSIDQLKDFMKKSEEDEMIRKMRKSSFLDLTNTSSNSRSRSLLNNNNNSSTNLPNHNENHPINGHGSILMDANQAMNSTSSSNSSNDNNNLSMDSGDYELRLTAERRRQSAYARKQAYDTFFADSSLADYKLLYGLGKGTFGTVYLCEHIRSNHHNGSGKLVALKCLDKRAIVDNGQHMYIRREIIALSTFQHPFISEYYGYFLTRNKICFILEFIPGMEFWSFLYTHYPQMMNNNNHHNNSSSSSIYDGFHSPLPTVINNNNSSSSITANSMMKHEFTGLPPNDAAIYAANIILAMEYIHGLGYVYRDLKPENLMIQAHTGYLKLIDFGFAKQVPFVNKQGQVQYRTFTLCGTPDYMAP